MLQVVFLVDWYNATGEDLFAVDRFPSLGNDAPPATAEGQVLSMATCQCKF
ncbi:hypothetical protein [Microvirga makkahensis]|uniref:Uncharacterized protein n=1 Tax=Microvirga makkahensis TaxID=1128670 RepID=A0A7X3SPI7_9HYPH|nr:hypothetical protein [Microvirga makkahensis]MXQ12273.1 hypothetical protein [Microvirga makkahensis]